MLLNPNKSSMIVAERGSGIVTYSKKKNNKGDFCLIGPFMGRITHAQLCCYWKFRMAACSGNFTSTLHADSYSLLKLVLAIFFFCVKNSVFNHHKTKAHSGQEMRDLIPALRRTQTLATSVET